MKILSSFVNLHVIPNLVRSVGSVTISITFCNNATDYYFQNHFLTFYFEIVLSLNADLI